MKKVALHSLGCKVNSYETDAMTRLFEKSGYEIVPFTEKADIYVINTCTVTNIADRKSRQMLHRAKKNNPQSIVVAAGCYVQADSQRAAKDSAVDLVVGNDQKNQIVSLVEQLINGSGENAVTDIGCTRTYEPLSIEDAAEHTRAYIKVQDGCNQFCSYCLIPYVRGRVRSRQPEEILSEAARLAQKGYQELVLTGIHLSSYGTDLTGDEELLQLVKSLHETEGIRRIRLGSLEPGIITESFAEGLAGLEKFCPHFHLSLQSGCDSVLERMNRHYTTKAYEEKCGLLRKTFDHPAITTDVIVGFPGETEEEFGVTEDFLKRLCLAEAHIFKYSRRKGTRADKMPDQVPDQVKARRSSRLLAVAASCGKTYRAGWQGRQAEALFEEQVSIGDELFWTGYTREYVRVAKKSRDNLENVILPVTVKEPLTEEILACESL